MSYRTDPDETTYTVWSGAVRLAFLGGGSIEFRVREDGDAVVTAALPEDGIKVRSHELAAFLRRALELVR